MSFFKAQVSSSSNIVSFFGVVAQTYHIRKKIFRIVTTRIKFIMSVLEPRVRFSSNFASLFSVMRHNSAVLFQLKLYMLWTKGAYQSANFQIFDCSHEI